MMPRAEAKLLFDASQTRLDGMQKTMGDLSTVLVGLRSELAGQDTGSADTQHAIDRNRTFMFAVLAAIMALVSLYFGFHQNTTNNNNPAPTTATTTAGK
jgi:hypothetical protein